MEDLDNDDYSIKIHINNYVTKQSGRVWYKYLTMKLLMDLGFNKLEIDECVLYRGSVMYILYKNDSIIAGQNIEDLDDIVADLNKSNLGVTVEGTL